MRRLGTTLLVVLLVLAGLFAGLDAVARNQAEKRVAQALTSRLGTTPSVSAHGWPFLATLATHRLAGADVSAPQASVEVAGRTVQVSDLSVQAQQLTDVTNLSAARAGAVEASGRLGYAQASRALGVTMTSAGGGRVRFHQDVQLFGQGLAADVVATPSVSGGRLVLSSPTVNVDGQQLPAATAQQVADLVASQVSLPQRDGFSVTGLQAADDGVVVQLHGTDVAVSKLR